MTSLSFKTQFAKTPVPYPTALATMQEAVLNQQQNHSHQGLLWFLEHPPIYTAGTSAKSQDLLGIKDIPVFQTGRGGQYTYHGPGQQIVYIVFDLKKWQRDVRAYVDHLQKWLIAVLAALDVPARCHKDRIGIWVDTKKGEAKIAAIGIRISRWIASHGIAFNIKPDLDHFKGIVPCGISDFGVTSLYDLGIEIEQEKLQLLMIEKFAETFHVNCGGHA